MGDSSAAGTLPRRSTSTAHSTDRTDELDRYAEEFAQLVAQFPPSRSPDPQKRWLRSIPGDAFDYYRWGICSYGREAQTPKERRGRLYLMHTGLLFLWMSYGRAEAETRFRRRTEQSTRRAASLVTLEVYQREGTVADYEVAHWFEQPVQQWRVQLNADRVNHARVPDSAPGEQLRTEPVVECEVDVFSKLRTARAVTPLHELVLPGA